MWPKTGQPLSPPFPLLHFFRTVGPEMGLLHGQTALLAKVPLEDRCPCLAPHDACPQRRCNLYASCLAFIAKGHAVKSRNADAWWPRCRLMEMESMLSQTVTPHSDLRGSYCHVSPLPSKNNAPRSPGRHCLPLAIKEYIIVRSFLIRLPLPVFLTIISVTSPRFLHTDIYGTFAHHARPV